MSQIKSKFIENDAIVTAKILDANVTGAKIESSAALAGSPTTTTQSLGTNNTTVATTAFVEAAVQANAAGLAWKQPVKLKSQANLASLTGLTLTDFDGTGQGVTLVAGDRVLLGDDQTTGSERGLYEVSGTDLVRPSDFDGAGEAEAATVFVQEGTDADVGYTQTVDSVTIDTTSQTWVQFNGASNIIAGDGLDKTGNTLSVDLKASGGLKIDTTELAVEPADFAGTGLEDDGSDNLRLAAQGNGISGGAGSTLSVNADTASTTTTEANAISVVANGVGIKVDDSTIEGSAQGAASTESLRVKDAGITTAKIADNAVDKDKINADIAGDGLSQAAGGEIDINAGDGLEINTDNLQLDLKASGGLKIDSGEVAVEPNDIAGSGLEDDGSDNLQINIDGTNGSTAINGSNEIVAARQAQEVITLAGGDITNQFIDLAVAAVSAASISVVPVGGPPQEQGVDYTVSLTGGAGGVTRLTFAGDLATGGDAALIATDKLIAKYEVL